MVHVARLLLHRMVVISIEKENTLLSRHCALRTRMLSNDVPFDNNSSYYLRHYGQNMVDLIASIEITMQK